MDDTPRRRTRAKFLKAKKPVQKRETKVVEIPREPEVTVSVEECDAVEVEIELPLEDVMDTGEESIREEVVRIETGSLNISPSRSQHEEVYASHPIFSPARESTGEFSTSSSLYRKTADLNISIKEKVAFEEGVRTKKEESCQVGIKDKGDLVSQEQLQEEHALSENKCMDGHFNIEKEYEMQGNGKLLERNKGLENYSVKEKVQEFLDVKHEEKVLKAVSDSVVEVKENLKKGTVAEEVQDKTFMEKSWSKSFVEKLQSETVGEEIQSVTDVIEMQDKTILKNLQSEDLVHEVCSNEDGKSEIPENDIRFKLIMEAVQSEAVVEDVHIEMEDVQSEVVVQDVQGEVIVQDVQGEVIVQDVQGEVIVQDVQGEVVVQDEQEETVVESESVMEDVQVESVAEDVQGELVAEDVQGELVAEDVQGESVAEDVQGESVAEDVQGESVAEDVQGESVVEDVQGESVVEDVQGESVVEDVQGESVAEDVQGESVAEDVQGESVAEDVQGESVVEDVQCEAVAGGVEITNTRHIVAGEECFAPDVVFGDKIKCDVSLHVIEDIASTAEVGEMTADTHVDSGKEKENTKQGGKPAGVWDDIEKLAEVACSEFLDKSSKKELVNPENNETQSMSSKTAGTDLDTAQIIEQKCNVEQSDVTEHVTSSFEKSISESLNVNDVIISKQKENSESTESSKQQNSSDYSIFTKNNKESLDRSQPVPSDSPDVISSEEIKSKKVELAEQIDSERTEVEKSEKVREYSAVEKLENFVRGAPTTDRGTVGRTRKKNTQKSFSEMIKNPAINDCFVPTNRAKKSVQRTLSVDIKSKKATLSDTANKLYPKVALTPIEVKKEGFDYKNSCQTTSTDGTTAQLTTTSKQEPNKGGTKRKRSPSSADDENGANSPRTPTRVEENVEFPKVESDFYKKPFESGWKREIVFRAVIEGKVQNKKGRMADIYYFSPTGQKLRSVKEVETYMEKNPDHQLPMTYFTFGKFSVFHEPFEMQRLANFKSKTPEIHSSNPTPIPKKKVSTPETKTSVAVVTDTHKKPSDNIPTSKGEKRQGPRIKYTPKRFKEDGPSPEPQQPAPPVTKVQMETATKSDSSKSEQTEVKKQVVAKKNENVETKKQNSQKTYSLLSNFKMDSTESVLCSLHCVGRNGQLPSLHCGVCLCLFHPECVGVAPTSRPSIFICQRCRKNIKEGKARLPPPGARPIIPQESCSSESKHTEQTNVESKYLHNGKMDEETTSSCKSSSKAESKIGTNTGISLVPEVVLTQEHSDEEECVKNSPLAPPLPVRTILPPPPPLTPAPLRSLGLRAVHPVNDFPPRLPYLHRQNSIPSNAFPSFNTGLVQNTSPVSSRPEVSGPVVQNVFLMPASSQASPSGPIPIPAMQASVFIPPSSGTSNVSSSFIPPFPHQSYSTPQLFQALSPQPLLETRTGPNAVVLGSQMIPGAQSRVPLPAHSTITNMPLLQNGFIVTGSLERPGPQVTYFPPPTTIPACTGSLQFQTVTTLAMCCANSGNTFSTAAVSIAPSLSPLLPQIPSLRSPLCSVVPVCPNKSTLEASIKTSEPICVSHPFDNDGSYVKTSSSSTSPEAHKRCSSVSEKVVDVQKIESFPSKKKPQVTTQSVGVQSEAPPLLPKNEPVVPETETHGVQTEIKLKDIEVTVDSDWLEEEDSSGEDVVSDKKYYKNKVLVKLREHAYSCNLKGQTPKKKLEVEKLKPSFCYVNRLVGGFECVNSIFQYLGVADLLSASQVSQTWRTLATQPFLWKFVCLGDLYITNWALCAKALECFNTTSLDLRDVGHLEDRATFWGYFIRILGHLRNLQHLAFGEVVPEVLPAVSETVTQLQTLTAECVTEATGASVWTTLCKVDFSKIGRLSYLNYLWVRGGGGLRLPSLMSNGGLQSLENLTMLRHLHLTTLVGVPSESFQFIEKLPLLESLAIGNCFSWTRETYALLGKLKQLKKLRLEKGGQLHDTSLQNAISNLTQLEELQLLCFVIPTSLGSGLQKLKHLSRLVLWPDTYRQAPKVNQNTLKAVSSLTKLKKFSWGVMSSQSDLEEMTWTEDNEEEHNDREIKMISLLRHKENCTCSKSEDGSGDSNPECTVMVHLNELEQRLSKLFPNTRITVFRVPLERFSEFCSAFR